MKTYEIIQVVEMSVIWKVRAKNADEANEKATQRTIALKNALTNLRKNINFGDVTDDYYVSARDEE